MHKFSFRAECELDVATFRTIFGGLYRKISMTITKPFPDVDVVLCTDVPIKIVRIHMMKVPDGHTMLSTLKELTNEPR